MNGQTVQRQLSRGRKALSTMADRVGMTPGAIREAAGVGAEAGAQLAMQGRAGQTVFDQIGENVRGLGFAIVVIVMVGFMIFYIGNLDVANNSSLVQDLITKGGSALTLIAGLFALLGLALIMRYVFAFLQDIGGSSGSRT
ncbi:MAG: hypothetical protein SVW02_00700 [Candidatus Nanohaloarchaea archaeon]|nr:hypothetical protein [Candidatus Nanohaloarchaea archaeon]